MNIYFSIILFTLLCLFLNDNDVSCISRGGGRGGGSRGGSRSGSRSSGSRSYRSGGSSYRSSGVIKSRSISSSYRYNSWSIRVGVSSGTRYSVSPWSTQYRAMLMGHIIMSSHYRSRFYMYREGYSDAISVCFNEGSLYGRNITASPWFVCPWDDPYARYCCGDEVEEHCCGYFDRPAHKTGLLVGLILITLFFCGLFYCYKRRKGLKDSSSVLFVADCKEAEGVVLMYPPAAPTDNYQPSTDPAPLYNNSASYPMPPNNSAPYPTTMDNTLPYATTPLVTDNNPPYPINSNECYNGNPSSSNQLYSGYTYPPTADNTLPYPANPAIAPASNITPYPTNEQTMTSNANAPPMGNYSTQLPPSYEDALKIKS